MRLLLDLTGIGACLLLYPILTHYLRFARHFIMAPTRLMCGQEPRPFIVLSATNTGGGRCSLTSDRPYISHIEREGGKSFAAMRSLLVKNIRFRGQLHARMAVRHADDVPSAWQMTHPQLTAELNTFHQSRSFMSNTPSFIPWRPRAAPACNTRAPLLPPAAAAAAAAHPESNSCFRCLAAPTLTLILLD